MLSAFAEHSLKDMPFRTKTIVMMFSKVCIGFGRSLESWMLGIRLKMFKKLLFKSDNEHHIAFKVSIEDFG